MSTKQKLRVALLSGGISSEREVSLKSGQGVFNALNKKKYEIISYDPKTDIARLVADAPKIDIALIIMHGPYGEDGTIQGLLDLLKIPYQGSGVLGSSIAMDKVISKRLYESAGLKVPPYMVINKGESWNAQDCIKHIGLPLVLKPVQGGSSVGMSIISSEADFEKAVKKAFKYDNRLLLETYISGTEITGGVIGNDELEALPLIEIIPDKQYEFFDYQAKYTPGATQEICPARLNEKFTGLAQECAKKAHNALSCLGYSRTDMILKDDQLFILETNTIPGMTPTSLLPQAAEAAGMDFSQLLDQLIKLGLEAQPQK
ncbi:D-alanine--D-alanine ligase [Candidatus Magnetomoraceae bacterium gMMP-1]